MQHCYKIIIAKVKFCPRGNLELRVFRVALEKSCKTVVSPYIFTVNILFLIVDTLRVQKNIVL